MAVLLVVVFLIVPVAEIYVIIQVGQVIGAVPTVVLLVLESMLGAWLIKREGSATWTALREGAASGRLPARELADAALVLVGATLLLTPGFLTDVVGFFFVLPLTRPLARRALAWFVARRATRAVSGHLAWTDRQRPRAADAGGPAAWAGPQVVQGETVTDDGPESGPDIHGPDHQGPDDERPGRAAGPSQG